MTFHQQWEPWVLYVLAGVEETSVWTTRKIRAIRSLMDDTTDTRAAAPKMPHAVIEQIFTQPYCRIGNLVEQGLAERHTVSNYLKELARLGILEEEKVGRDKVFLHRKYLDVLFSDGHTFEPYPRAVAHEHPSAERHQATARAILSVSPSAAIRLADVQARIAAAAQAAKRDPSSVQLVAVTKTFGPEHIQPVLDAGHRMFGENRVQEAKAQVAGAARALSRRRAAPDRAAAVQQGEGGRRAVRRDPHHRPAQDRRGHRRGNGEAGQAPAALHPGQHRRGAAEGGRRCRRRPQACSASAGKT